jgi:hypothetical protein
MIQFTAKLTGNRRDTETLSPKALLILIDPSNELGRDHCWIDLYFVESIQPKGHHKPKLIQFQAELKEYKRRGTEVDYTLTNLSNIKILRRTK